MDRAKEKIPITNKPIFKDIENHYQLQAKKVFALFVLQIQKSSVQKANPQNCITQWDKIIPRYFKSLVRFSEIHLAHLYDKLQILNFSSFFTDQIVYD